MRMSERAKGKQPHPGKRFVNECLWQAVIANVRKANVLEGLENLLPRLGSLFLSTRLERREVDDWDHFAGRMVDESWRGFLELEISSFGSVRRYRHVRTHLVQIQKT
jgi:hypothetical protein